MFEKLRAFIAWKYSFLLLFVPYLNIVFIILFLLLAPEKHLFKAIPVLFIGSISLYLLNKVVPEHFSCLIPIFITTAIAIAAFFFLKKHYDELYRPNRKRVLFFGVITALLIVLCISVFGSMKKLGLREKTEIYIQAIVEGDNAKLHTVSYSQEADAGKIMQGLQSSGIQLEGNVRVEKQDSFSSKTVNGETTAHAVFLATVGDDSYVVEVNYLDDDYGTGIQNLKISKGK